MRFVMRFAATRRRNTMTQDAASFSARWPDRERRLEIQQALDASLADAIETLQSGPVAPRSDPDALRARLGRFDFREPLDPLEASRSAIDLLAHGTVHVMHPGYFGLFNPSVTFPSILADQITAHFNPQLAVWSHAPAAVEVERHVVEAIGGLAGWHPDEIAGHFTSGGAEANNTAVLMALTAACPGFAECGGRAFSGQPCLYVSSESHLAWFKIAHQAGIGRKAVRLVPTDGTGRLDPRALEKLVETDRAEGDVPVFIGATAGTTNGGMIDPLEACHAISRANGVWFHVDAAWGGAGLVDPRSAEHLRGIECADSLTIDAHKWFAVPMGAGMFLCRDQDLLGETFRVAASYMPESTKAAVDPYTHSLQWSRRFAGLKLFLSLACMGWSGYRDHVEQSLRLAGSLKSRLADSAWRVVNDSPLAVVCFIDGRGQADAETTADQVVSSGRAWLSTARFEGRTVLRACITSHFTRDEHIALLVDELNRSRAAQCLRN